MTIETLIGHNYFVPYFERKDYGFENKFFRKEGLYL